VLDADDYFAPDRIETLMDAAGEDWDLAADGVTMLREDGDARSVQRLDFRTMVGRDLLRAEDFICGNIVRPGAVRMELGFMKPLLRREFLQRRGMRFDESLRLGEDYALYAEALIRGARFRLVASCGYVSVWRAGSLSSSHVGADLAALAEADSRLLRIEPMSASVKIALHQHRASTLRRADYRILLELKQKRRFRRFATFSLTRPLVVAHALREKMRGILAGAA
jgi:succinoglycan biosynthesis protein ExoU